MKKHIIICFYGKGESRHYGTLEELVHVFGRILEEGHFWNDEVALAPKTAKELVSALNKSAYEVGEIHKMFILEK